MKFLSSPLSPVVQLVAFVLCNASVFSQQDLQGSLFLAQHLQDSGQGGKCLKADEDGVHLTLLRTRGILQCSCVLVKFPLELARNLKCPLWTQIMQGNMMLADSTGKNTEKTSEPYGSSLLCVEKIGYVDVEVTLKPEDVIFPSVDNLGHFTFRLLSSRLSEDKLYNAQG